MSTGGRLFLKNGSEADWNKVNNYIPTFGEPLVYNADENHPYPRLKFGDDIHLPRDLPFVDAGTISGVDLNHIEVDKLKHTLTFGAGEAYVFDGSADVTVPVYTGKINSL